MEMAIHKYLKEPEEETLRIEILALEATKKKTKKDKIIISGFKND